MRSFTRKLILYLLPFALIIAVVNGVLIFIGEAMPLAWVVAVQQSQEALYRPQYGNRDVQFKTLSVNARRPQMIAVGSSRVLQMRAQLFTEQRTAFYNAGAPAWQLEQVDTLIRSLDPLPRVIIIGVDPVWFNADYVPQLIDPPISDFSHLFAVNRSLLQDTLTGRRQIDLAKMLQRREPAAGGLALGLRAIGDGHGFRSDGSEQYGDFLVAGYLWQPTERERHLEWMRAGVDMYVYGETLDTAKLEQLDRLLSYLEERGVQVIGFAPPFAPSLYAEMTARGNHRYMDSLDAFLTDQFARRGFTYLNYADSRALDATDEDFYDGWHGSERVYLRLFIRMVESLPDVFAPFVNLDRLRAVDAQATDTFRVF